jgi:cytoskeletal protein CcmA (bactofilin family)
MATISMKAKPSRDKKNLSNGKNNAPLRGVDTNCVVSSGTRVEGDFTATENVRLDGSLKGTLKCEKRLVIGQNGQVEGEVHASEAVIMGSVNGNVKIDGSLHLQSTARIEGDIAAKYLIVEEGAAYNGQCKVGS